MHNLGIYVGENFEGATGINPRGFFENKDLIDHHCNATSTASAGGIAKAVNEATLDGRVWKIQDIVYRLRVEKLCCDYGVWAIKDPRLCLPNLFTGLTHLIDGEVRVIRTRRDDLDVLAKSWTAAWGGDEDDAKEVYKRFIRLRDRKYKKFKGAKMTVEYNQLIEETESVVRQIADFVDVPITQSAIDFIDPGLRRSG